jgi:hypothetical protein
MKLHEITQAAGSKPLTFSMVCQCAAYNYPDGCTDEVFDTLTNEGAFAASDNAEVTKAFPDIVKELNDKLAKKSFDKDYPDFYTDVTKIEIESIEIGISYTNEDDDDDDEEDDEEDDGTDEGHFPRAGSNGQDYVNIELSIYGADDKKIAKDTMEDVALSIGSVIGEALYGQYFDGIDPA